jgi:hypothetical protein
MTFEVLTAMIMKIMVFWDVMLYSLVVIFEFFWRSPLCPFAWYLWLITSQKSCVRKKFKLQGHVIVLMNEE